MSLNSRTVNNPCYQWGTHGFFSGQTRLEARRSSLPYLFILSIECMPWHYLNPGGFDAKTCMIEPIFVVYSGFCGLLEYLEFSKPLYTWRGARDIGKEELIVFRIFQIKRFTCLSSPNRINAIKDSFLIDLCPFRIWYFCLLFAFAIV